MNRSKKPCYFVLLIACLLFCIPAGAEVAQEITRTCHIVMNRCKDSSSRMLDRDTQTASTTGELRDPTITITLGDTSCAGVYIVFGKNNLPFNVQVRDGSAWKTVAAYESDTYPQVYASFDPIPAGSEVRLQFLTGKKYRMLSVRELYLFGAGETNPLAHIWQPPTEDADLMVVAAHPDDELLWFGGTIPYYAGELGMDVVVSYLTCSNSMRQAELLDGIWHCGVRTYPDISYYPDKKLSKISDTYKAWGGETAVMRDLAQRIRRFKPEVIVTHAVDGEYGHYAHRTCANAMQKVIALAADPTFDPTSAAEYGAWQVQKLYLHKGSSNLTVMDWRQPLDFFGGKTAYDIAVEAYNFHGSQPHSPGFYEVADEDDEHNSFLYTLVYSAVGPDEAGGDFFEHLDRSALAAD